MHGHMVLWRAEFERPVERRQPRAEAPPRPKRTRRMATPAVLVLGLLVAAPLLRVVWLGGL